MKSVLPTVVPVLVALCLLQGCGGGGASGGTSAPSAADIATFPVPDPVGTEPERAVSNVLLIVLEDMGQQAGVYGTAGAVTPNIDAFAAQAARYDNAYVTLATCSASKASLYTGYYNHTTGATNNVQEYIGSAEQLEAENPSWLHDSTSAYNLFRIPDAFPTLIERAEALGMFTGLQNKFHLSPHTKFPYDLWYENSSQHYAEVTDFIQKASASGKPWLLVHGVYQPHRPYPDGTTTTLKIDPAQVVLPAYLPDSAAVREDWAEYLQAIYIADRYVGDILRALDDSGEADQTLVILLGDHGPSYHRGKFSTYDFGLRIPLMFRGPGIAADTLREELFSGVDMTPTIMDFLGRNIGSQGISHRAELTGATPAESHDVLVGEASTDLSVYDGHYQLIYMPKPANTVMPADNRDFDPWRNRVYQDIVANQDSPGYEQAYRLLDLADSALPRYDRPRFEFYDVQADRWEVNDLYADPAHAADIARLKDELSDWMDANGYDGEKP